MRKTRFKKRANFSQVGAISGNTNIDEEFRPQATQTHNVFNINISNNPIRACILLYFFARYTSNSDDKLNLNVNNNVRPYMYEPEIDDLPSESNSESGFDSSE